MNHRIFIALSTFAEENHEPLHLLKSNGMTVAMNPTGRRLTDLEVVQFLPGHEAVIAGLETYGASEIKTLKDLRCISRCGVGLDNIDLNAANDAGIRIYNTPHPVIQPVAELTLALIFDVLRRVTEHTASMRQHQWKRIAGEQLAGKMVGIIGLGRIGRRVAELLIRLDVHVCGYDISPDLVWAKTHHVQVVDLKTLLNQSNIVTLHVSGDEKNDFCLSSNEFYQMKKGSSIINTSRGSFIDEIALCECLQNGHLASAGIDVFSKEPYAGPLCDFPNVIVTPHIATLTKESRYQMEIEAVQNILNFFKKG